MIGMDRTRRSRAPLWMGVLLALAGIAGGGLWLAKGRRRSDPGEASPKGPGRPGGMRLLAGGEEAPPATGVIAGRVLGPDGAGVAGAVLAALRQRVSGALPGPPGAMTPRTATAETDGSFRFEGLAPGRYTVAASGPGMLGAVRGGLELAPGGTIADVVLRLEKGGLALSGRVLDVGGGTISGASVIAHPVVQPGGEPGDPVAFPTITDDAGQYRLQLPAGRYMVRASAVGYTRGGAFVELNADDTRDIRLEPAARITGRVVADGRPVAGAHVSVVGTDRRAMILYPVEPVVSDESGGFQVVGLQAGSYDVLARKGGLAGRLRQPLTVAAASAVEGVQINLAQGAVLEGTVKTTAGNPITGARIVLYPRSPMGLFNESQARSDESGRYRIEGLETGSYQIDARAEGYGAERSVVNVSGATTRDFVLPDGVIVSGVVLTSAGAPARGAEIQANTRGNRSYTDDRAQADGEGRFSLERLGPGALTVLAKLDGEVANVGPASVAPGERKQLTIKLAPGARVFGVVTWDDGTPAANITVNGMARGGGGLRSQTRSGADGKFELGPFVPGETSVTAQASGATVTWSSRARPEQVDFTIVAAEHKTGVKLVVTRKTGTIRGLVTDPAGKPVAGASVVAAKEREAGRAYKNDMHGGGRAVSGGDGSFAIEGLASGTFTLWVTHPGHPELERPGIAAGAMDVRLQLRRSASLAGVVVDAAGKPVRRFSLLVVPPARSGESDGARFSRASSEAKSLAVDDAGGAFRVGDLAAGTYELLATAPDGAAARSQPLVVGEGEAKRGLRLAIEAGTTIVGRVLEYEGGQPLAGVRVTLRHPGALKQAVSDASGAFTLSNVPAVPSVSLSFDTEPRTHAPETMPLSPAKDGRIDLGAIKLLKLDPKNPNKGRFGVSFGRENGKLVIRDVMPDLPAARAGLRKGDVVIAVNGKSLEQGDVSALLAATGGDPGKDIQVTVQAAGEQPRVVTLNRLR